VGICWTGTFKNKKT